MQVQGPSAAMAMQTVTATPQVVAPESAPVDRAPVSKSAQGPALAMAVAQSMPDASAVAAMQNLAGLPAAI